MGHGRRAGAAAYLVLATFGSVPVGGCLGLLAGMIAWVRRPDDEFPCAGIVFVIDSAVIGALVCGVATLLGAAVYLSWCRRRVR